VELSVPVAITILIIYSEEDVSLYE